MDRALQLFQQSIQELDCGNRSLLSLCRVINPNCHQYMMQQCLQPSAPHIGGSGVENSVKVVGILNIMSTVRFLLTVQYNL